MVVIVKKPAKEDLVMIVTEQMNEMLVHGHVSLNRIWQILLTVLRKHLGRISLTT